MYKLIRINSRRILTFFFIFIFFHPPQSVSATSPASPRQEQPSLSLNSEETNYDHEASIDDEDEAISLEDSLPAGNVVNPGTVPPIDAPTEPLVPEESVEPSQTDKQTNNTPPDPPIPDIKTWTEEARTDAAQSQSFVNADLLSNVVLSGKYTQPNTVELRFSGEGILKVNALSEVFTIFQIPENLFPYIDESSIVGTYKVPEIAALGVIVKEKSGKFSPADQTVDSQKHQIRFNTKTVLSLGISLLATYEYSLTFKLKRLPLNGPQSHDFFAGMTKSSVDIAALSNGVGTWTLTIPEAASPLYFLEVPDSISFGTVGIRSNMQHIYRSSAMTVSISHQNAVGYPYQLTARASPLASSSQILNDAVQFKRKDGTAIPLNGAAQLISSGNMTPTSTTLVYAPQEGIFLDLNGQTPKAGSFATTIEWTLIDSL